jgi:hypothetical protein
MIDPAHVSIIDRSSFNLLLFFFMGQHLISKRLAVASALLDRSSSKNYKPLWTPHASHASKIGDSTFPPVSQPVLPTALLREYDHATTPRNPSFPTRRSGLDSYIQFGEECASRNLVPSYRLFEHWMKTDLIAVE